MFNIRLDIIFSRTIYPNSLVALVKNISNHSLLQCMVLLMASLQQNKALVSNLLKAYKDMKEYQCIMTRWNAYLQRVMHTIHIWQDKVLINQWPMNSNLCPLDKRQLKHCYELALFSISNILFGYPLHNGIPYKEYCVT